MIVMFGAGVITLGIMEGLRNRLKGEKDSRWELWTLRVVGAKGLVKLKAG